MFWLSKAPKWGRYLSSLCCTMVSVQSLSACRHPAPAAHHQWRTSAHRRVATRCQGRGPAFRPRQKDHTETQRPKAGGRGGAGVSSDDAGEADALCPMYVFTNVCRYGLKYTPMPSGNVSVQWVTIARVRGHPTLAELSCATHEATPHHTTPLLRWLSTVPANPTYHLHPTLCALLTASKQSFVRPIRSHT